MPDSVVTVDPVTLVMILHPDPKSRPISPASATMFFEPDIGQLHQDGADRVLAGFRHLRTGTSSLGTTALITTSLDGAVQAFEDRLQLSRFSIELVAAQLLLAAALAVAFISGHALERQRHAFAVWRSRGWSWHAIWRLLLLETSALAVAAVPVGLALAWLASVLLARRFYDGLVPWLPRLQPETLLPAAALGLAVAMSVMAAQAYAASRRELLEVRREASRPALRGWWQRGALDLGLAVLSLPLLGATRLLGQSDVRSHGAGSGDPISLALPGLALIFVGVALLRLLPVAGAVSGLLTRRLPAALASLQLRRRPVQHAGLALLIIVTTALGIFASVYQSSAPSSAADRAAYAAGSDIRAHLDGERPPVAEAVASLRGVEAASFVFRGGGTTAVGSGFQPTIVAVDPYTFRQVVWSRPDLAARPLPALAQELAERDASGLELPGRPDRVGIWVSSSGFAADLRVDVMDAAGHAMRADLGSLSLQGWRYLEANVTPPAGSFHYPLKLRDLAIEPQASGSPASGSLALSELAVSQPGNSQPTVVDRFAPDEKGLTEWWRAPGSPGALQLPAPLLHDGGPALRLDYDHRDGTVLVEPPRSAAPIPALAPISTLARAGLQVGRPFSMIVESVTAEFVVVDVVDHFPTLYPEAEDFMVVAQAPLLAAIAHDSGRVRGPPEAWLRVTAAADDWDLATLLTRTDVTSVDDRRKAEAAARRDPVLLQLETTLLLGFGAAMALTVVSVVVHFLVTVQGRLGEYAILQANGLGRRTILRSLAVEETLLVVSGVVAGGLTGLGLAWALIPALQLGSDLASLVPPTVITVDPVLSGVAIAAVALLALGAARLANRAGSRFRLMDELRLLG
ncbi:MAG TPA: FtsX-like permease family protein [Candidatus Dormibacteraeota bacterium]|nr:FtsX-like permease family protein [Candidatus Dormibacteraeota bacterium]